MIHKSFHTSKYSAYRTYFQDKKDCMYFIKNFLRIMYKWKLVEGKTVFNIFLKNMCIVWQVA